MNSLQRIQASKRVKTAAFHRVLFVAPSRDHWQITREAGARTRFVSVHVAQLATAGVDETAEGEQAVVKQSSAPGKHKVKQKTKAETNTRTAL